MRQCIGTIMIEWVSNRQEYKSRRNWNSFDVQRLMITNDGIKSSRSFSNSRARCKLKIRGPAPPENFTPQITGVLIYTLGSGGADRFRLKKRSARCSTGLPKTSAITVRPVAIPRTDQYPSPQATPSTAQIQTVA